MQKEWGIDLIRGFFASIDKAIYGLMSTIYQIILDLADSTIISSAQIEDIYMRVYALLGIFMLFKITFSFVNYIINPDTFLDKTKGVQNIIKKVIIVLILIIITPFAFDKLYEAQRAILVEDKIIPKLILGNDGTDRLLQNSFSMSAACNNFQDAIAASDGDYLSLMSLRPFYQLDSAHFSDISNYGMFDDRYCTENSTVTVKEYLVSTIYNAEASDGTYLVEYKYFLSTVVGFVVCLILVSFCFDVAVRSIKLAFLEILAPIPILSYIDPASSKNGMLSKWLKQVGSTWISLFIRFIALFFAMLVISKIDSNISNEGEYSFWVMLFLIIGALIFAKQLPKLLEELIPGLKLGGLQLNPFKRVANEAMFGKEALGLGAAGLGFGLGALSNLGSHIKDKVDERNDWRKVSEQQLNYNRWKREHPRGNMTEDAYNRMLERKANEPGGLNEAQRKFEEQQEKRLQRFSFSHPFISNISQALTGAKIAFNQGKNLKFDPIQVGKQSSEMRDYKDKFSAKDRITDKATDFFGVKNDSGTTSVVKQGIKEQSDLLTRINRNIEMQNRALSDMQTKMGPAEFAKALKTDEKGNYTIDANYSGQYKNDLQAIINRMSELETQRLSVTKEINRLEKIRDQKPPKPGK